MAETSARQMPAVEPGARPARLASRDRPVSRDLSNVSRVSTVELGRLERERSRALGRVAGQADRRSKVLDRAAAQASRRAATREREAAEASKRAEALEDAQWTSPVAQYSITARFGQSSYLWSTTHTGVDMAAPTGTAVGAVGGGTVVFAGYDGPYGNLVIVRHDDGTETWYAHLNSLGAAVDEVLAAGQQLGTVGSTGNVTGAHLHLEVRPGGLDPVDPVSALAERGVTLG